MAVARGALAATLAGFLSRLRFPVLFALTAFLFLLDLFWPDVVPFVDEIFLGAATVLLASWKRRRAKGRLDTAVNGDEVVAREGRDA